MSDELEWATLRCDGPDATTFLDGQLSQDLSSSRNGAWTLLLTPDGDIVTSAWLRGDDSGWDLLVPSSLADAALSRLRRFLIRVKCEIDVTPGASDPPLRRSDERLDQRWPWDAEFARAVAPHSFGKSFVATTVSFTKGCFTGQELVGRMDARGATMPWRFVLARGRDATQLEAVLRSKGPDGPQGITSQWRRHDDVVALGFAHRSLLSAPLENSEVVIEEIA